jgi:hypothetical protein
MTFLRVEIIRYVEAYQPGIVACAFSDAEGTRHTFIEKLPLVTAQDLWWDSTYPQPGSAECAGVEYFQDATGRRVARITLDFCESLDSPPVSSFVVLESQLSDDCCS